MQSTSRVLFLCSGNYYRSRFAEAFFNHHAGQQGLCWTALSRGFRLSPKNVGPISEHAIAGLQERGVPLAEPRMPQVASEADLDESQLIIALKEAEHRPLVLERFARWGHRVEYWRIHDIDFAAPRIALAQLDEEIRSLLERLGARA